MKQKFALYFTHLSLASRSVSDSGQLHVALPATAPLGSDFSFSIMFSNLAQLFVGTVNLSVVVFPSLQVSSSSSFDVSVAFFAHRSSRPS